MSDDEGGNGEPRRPYTSLPGPLATSADGTPAHPEEPAVRDVRGRYLPGWRGGPGMGSPQRSGRKALALRAAVIDAVSGEDLADLARAMLRYARGGDMVAARELFLRTIGRPHDADMLDRIEAIEVALGIAEPGDPLAGLDRAQRLQALDGGEVGGEED